MSKHNYAEYAETDLQRKAPARQNQTQTRHTELMSQASDSDRIKEAPQTKKGRAKSRAGGS